MSTTPQNPLLSQQKSDSDIQVALHPLVLLTISDYITRHTLRNQTGPIVGALLGQQNGRELTVEHAFECKMDGDVLDEEWFSIRLQQMKDVHKAPPLDLVGWYTLVPTSGPQPHHIVIQEQLSSSYSECSVLLGFHPTAILEGSVGGKLPLTIYEVNFDFPEANEREDVEMKDTNTASKVMYKELTYTVETGEAEMISIDFVAKGGGNATAVEAPKKQAPVAETATKLKGKKRAKADEAQEGDNTTPEDLHILSREDEELVASLTAKANAIKMLQSRINLITTYLEKLPPSYVEGKWIGETADTNSNHTEVNHSILRSIQALLNRLALLVPSDSVAFSNELLAEQNDVHLVELLSTLTQSIQGVRELGRKFGVVELGRQSAKKMTGSSQMPIGWEQGNTGFDMNGGGRQSGAGDLML